MCGITGIYAFTESGKSGFKNLSASVDALKSRGPDAKGKFMNGQVALGHTRLSIIDVSENANQPMWDETNRYTIIYNGEMYNFRELRKELQDKGMSFKTNSDTEVLLKLYIHFGKNCLDMLNGFFAFAVYDKAENVLFIARDRIGIKPLLIYQDRDKLIFASEMKALMVFGIPQEIDTVSLYQYLQLNYIPAPATILAGVRKLMPGHCLLIKNDQVEEKQYYKIPFNNDIAGVGHAQPLQNYEQQQKKLVELLEDSVRKRLIADVPLGAFLSGGIDSSVIVALASRHTDKLNTFSIGYKDEPFFDETHYANLVAKKFNTNHTVFSLTNDDLFEHLFDTLNYIDEPFADSSALAVNILSYHTRKHVKVALSGDGADELFAGYDKYLGEYKARNGGFGATMLKYLHPLWEALPKSRNSYFENKIRQFHRFSQGMKLSEVERYWLWCGFVDENEALKLITPLIEGGNDKIDLSEYQKRKDSITQKITGKNDINEVLYCDMNLALQNDMLVKVDMMSMANSLEVRVPFLDHELVNFAFSLPESSKIDHRSNRKKIVRDAFRQILPDQLYNRPKHGFEVPLLKWFRNELKSTITDDLLNDDLIKEQGIFDEVEVKRLKQKLFSKDPGDVHARIWGLVVFQYWWRRWN